uniref:Eukaryotic translation initiation factor 3 subunit B n=1 Tax=Chlamydomonas euryale TaxID=1486919 RepID=A0A7R9YYS4_9CHLO|mmetsp:Transcript_33813/g.100686  ORF Transcript_33813/g.100686 Transcript_33813/m.100686 type:complete len:714 (+) Transcript_33813:29-2170(+)
MDGPEIDSYAIAADLFPDQPEGFPLDGFDLAAIKLPDDDDLGIPSDDDADNEQDLQTETGFGSVLVVSNLPIVPPEKFEKLEGVVKTILSTVGSIREGGFHMPVDEATKMSKGFAFIEFATPMEAQTAREQTNGYKLGKNVFAVNMFDDFDKYAKVPDEYVQPDPKAFQGVDNIQSWMVDKMGRDQFVIRSGDNTEVFWNDGKRGKADMVYQRQHWTESFVQWSPLGNYITTMHRQGAAIWAGPEWTRLQRLAHPNIRLIDYSPNERYMVSYSSHEPMNPRDTATVTFNVFDTRTARKLRAFEGPAEEYTVGASSSGGALQWPIFKWAGGKDDAYFAKLSKNAISVYQAPDMGLLDKRSLKMEAVQDFVWSPSDPILSAYTAEQGNLPARIVLVKIPERVEVRQKNLFSVSDVKMYWHPQGDYFAVKVERFTKSKKSVYTGFELFSIRDQDVPMEVLELPNKSDKVHNFAWEPKGHRFAVVHGEGPRPSVTFYSMRDDKGRLSSVRLLGTVPGKSCNSIFWSPAGKNIVLAGLKGMNGQLEFFNVDEMETMATAEHFMATDVEWDPTGRYVATSVTTIHQMENGFKMWSFHGRLLYEASKDRLYQLSWRPRLPSMLSAEKEAEIQKNLKSYSKRYDEEDENLLRIDDDAVLAERKSLLDEWQQFKAKKKDYVAMLEDFRKQMYGSKWDEKESRLEKVSVEQVIESKEEPYNNK